MLLAQTLVLVLTLGAVVATKPPGYKEKPKVHDPNPPDYKYSYSIDDDISGSKQGHLENRKGEHTQGRYYVDDPKESSSQEVRYIADDWGFHPLVQYSSRTSSGHSSARLALGEAAVNGLQDAKELSPIVPLLAGTVLPAGTSTSGFIHHDNQNGVQTHLAMTVQPSAPAVTLQPEPTLLLPTQQNPLVTLASLRPQEIPTQNIQRLDAVTTVLSPISQEYTQEQNLYHSPSGGVKYSSNVGGDKSRSSVSVELGNVLGKPSISTNAPRFAAVTTSGQVVQPNFHQQNANFVNIQQGIRDSSDNGDSDSSYDSFQDGPDGSPNGEEGDYILTTQVNGQYGEKLDANVRKAQNQNKGIVYPRKNKVKFVPKKNVLVSSTTQAPIIQSSTIRIQNLRNENNFAKLVESTQNLVSNEDLLNINGAEENGAVLSSSAESYSFNDQAKVVNIKPNIVTLRGSINVGGQQTRPTGSGIVFIERNQDNYQYDQRPVLPTPIIVPDFDYDYNNNEVSSTQINGNIYSTTQSTVDVGVTKVLDFVTQQTYGKPLDSTVIVTPRPVSQKFLAPLTAGLNLVSSNNVDKFLDCAHKEETDVKYVEDEVIEQENEENKAITEINKSTQSFNVQQPTDNPQIQYPSALEESKKIQVNSNQQFYQLGAQQVLIHPADQQDQLAAEEINQQLEEHQEETAKQQQYFGQQQNLNQQSQIYKQRETLDTVTQNSGSVEYNTVNQDYSKNYRQTIGEHTPGCNDDYGHSSNALPSALPLIQQNVHHVIHHSSQNINQGLNQGLHQAQSQQAQYFYIPQHGNQQAYIPQPQPYLLYGIPQQNTLQHIRQHQQVLYPQVGKSLNFAIHHQIPYPTQSHQPQRVEKVVERLVEKPVHVTTYVEKQYPSNVQVPYNAVEKPYPVHVERIVENKLPYPVEVKIPYKIQAQSSLTYLYPVVQPNQNRQASQINYNQNQQNFVDQGYSYNKPKIPFNPSPQDNTYAPSIQPYTNTLAKYLGPVPPRGAHEAWNFGSIGNLQDTNSIKSERTQRGYRIEYGFKPPLIPSVQIDLNGQPIKRGVH